ncbi:MAG: amidohydrolase family protein [Spirochaetia bacterium]|nr:amidohydrolase family protein [Spirochaetia bacterium]
MTTLTTCSGPPLARVSPAADAGYVIQDVRVFTADEKHLIIEHADVYVRGEKIEKISTERLQIPGAVVIQGRGRTLLPGLSDCHTHITGGMIIPWKMALLPSPEHNLRAALYSGITAVWDMGGKTVQEMNQIRHKIESGSMDGPMIYHSGIAFTGQGAHPVPYLGFVKDNIPFFLNPFVPDVAYEVHNGDGVAKIRSYTDDARPDFTKIYLDKIPEDAPVMSDDAVGRLVSASHEKKIPAVFHIGSNENLRTLIASGGDGAVHNVYKEPVDIKLARAMAAKGIFVVPTIVAWYNYFLVVNKRSYTHFTALEYQTMDAAHRDALRNPQPDNVVIRDQWRHHDSMHVQYTDNLYPNLKAMKDSGVTILAGSDAPNYALALGGSLHTELAHMVKAGMTNTEALLAATSHPPKVLAKLSGREINYGEVREGALANLLLVDGDPVKNITDTQNIADVFFRGRRVNRVRPDVN